jgi:hypothetical protein
MKALLCLPVLWLLAAVVGAQQSSALAPPVHARVSAEPLAEMSGIVKSRRRANVYWVHNDSGDGARIFAIDGDGKAILPTWSRFSYYGEEREPGKQQWQGFEVLDAKHVDWEDIAVDANYLYLADIGNNGNARRDLAIYMVSEIDPTASTRTAVIKKLPIVYPDQQAWPPQKLHFDSESLFVADGKLYLITKHRAGGLLGSWEAGAKLYRLDTAYSDRNNVLTLVDMHPAIMAATAADLAPDGQTLAVLSYDALWLFSRSADGGDQWLSAPARRIPLDTTVFRQAEGLAWEDADTLLVTNEQRDMLRIPVATLAD